MTRLALILIALATCSVSFASTYTSAIAEHADRNRGGDSQTGRGESNAAVYEQWGLSEAEWNRYQLIMQGPLGYRNPGLEPPLALAHAAQSESETRRYLRIYIETTKQIWDRGKEMEVFHREELFSMYPQLYPLERDKIYQSDEVIRPGDRFLFLVNSSCTSCQKTASSLLSATKTFPNGFDIYVQDAAGDEEVVNWAMSAFTPADMQDDRITLNARNQYLAPYLGSGENWKLYIRRGDRLFPANAFDVLSGRSGP